MGHVKITFKDGSNETFVQSEISMVAIDEKSRIVYVLYPKTIVRIPFEAIKMIEEVRDGENEKK
jgi:hypothetical protein